MRGSTIRKAALITGIASLSLAVGLGSASAGPNGHHFGKIAAKDCAKQRKQMGNEAFVSLYGKPAQPNCIGVTKPDVADATQNASQECRASRAELGVGPFRDLWGTNGKEGKNGHHKNAFGKCVSAGVKQELAEERQDIVNAAKECKAQRDELGVGPFRDLWGTNGKEGKNGHHKNAFGKCVSETAKNKPNPPTPTGPSGPTGPTV